MKKNNASKSQSETEIALQESELKFRETVKYLDEGYYSVTIDGLLLDHNQAFNRILGFDIDQDLKGVKLPDFWQNPDERKVYLQELMTRGFIRNYLINAKTIGGEKIVVMANSHLVKDEKGGLVRIEGTYNDFTERKRAKEALRENEKSLQDAQRLAKIGSWKWVVATNTVQWSEELCQINGYDSKLPAPGFAEMSSFYTPESWKRLNEVVTKALNSGESYELDLDLVRKDGNIIKTIARGVVDYDANGMIVILHGTVQDITGRKLAEEALRESEEKLKEAQTLGRIGSWEFDIENQKILWSDQTYKLYDRNPALGPPTSEEEAAYYSPEQVKTLHKYAHRAIEEGKDFEYDIEAKLPGGRVVYFSAKMQPVKNEYGQVTKLFGTVQDITERKRTEEEIIRSEYLRNMLLDNLPLVTLVLKKHTREIVACNKLAVEAGAVIGKTCYETLAHCNHICPFCKAPDMWETGKEQQVEAEYIGRYWEGRWMPFSDDLYIHYILDITEQKQAEEEIRKSKKLLEDLHKHLTEIRENERALISREIHDQIGQSLTALKLDLNWMHKYINTNQEAVAKLEGMIELVSNTIKDVQRISSDLRPGILDDLGLAAAIEWYSDEFEKRTGIRCSLRLDDSTFGDSQKNLVFFRVLQEALTNVIRHANASSVSINSINPNNVIP